MVVEFVLGLDKQFPLQNNVFALALKAGTNLIGDLIEGGRCFLFRGHKMSPLLKASDKSFNAAQLIFLPLVRMGIDIGMR